MKLLKMLLLVSGLTCCSPIIFQTKDCGFYRLIYTHLLSGSEVEIVNIKANNVDACRCPKYEDLPVCKRNKEKMKKIKKRQRKENISWWMVWK